MLTESVDSICGVYRQRTSSSSSSSTKDSSGGSDDSKNTSVVLRKSLGTPNSSNFQRRQWRQSAASLSPSLYSRTSSSSSKLRLRRNVHMMKGSGSSRSQLLQAQQNTSQSASAALATFQARLCLGTDYLPVYELNDFHRAAPTSSQSSSSSSTSLAQSDTLKKRTGSREFVKNKIVVAGRKKKKPIKRLTFLRLTAKGIVFSDVPSIKLHSESSFRKLTRKTSDLQASQKPLVRRTPSVQKAILCWSSIDHIWLKKRRMDLHLKVGETSEQQKTASVLQFKFTIIRDVYAFITAGLALGYLRSEGLVLSSSSEEVHLEENDNLQAKTSSSSSNPKHQSCSTPSSSSTSEQEAAKRPANIFANIWGKLKRPSSKGKAAAEISSSSIIFSPSTSSESCPDSTTAEGKEGEKKRDSQKSHKKFAACVRWANRALFQGRLRRRRSSTT